MDKKFMRDYFKMKYEDGIGVLVKNNEVYQQMQAERSKLEKELCDKCGGIDSNLWKLHEKSLEILLFSEEELVLEAYLQGAEDRERMLK